MYLVLHILLCGDKRRFRKLLVVARYLYLFAVFGNFLKIVVERGKFLEFLLKVMLHFHRDLVGSLGDDAYCFINISRVLCHFHHVAGDSVKGELLFL